MLSPSLRWCHKVNKWTKIRKVTAHLGEKMERRTILCLAELEKEEEVTGELEEKKATELLNTFLKTNCKLACQLTSLGAPQRGKSARCADSISWALTERSQETLVWGNKIWEVGSKTQGCQACLCLQADLEAQGKCSHTPATTVCEAAGMRWTTSAQTWSQKVQLQRACLVLRATQEFRRKPPTL